MFALRSKHRKLHHCGFYLTHGRGTTFYSTPYYTIFTKGNKMCPWNRVRNCGGNHRFTISDTFPKVFVWMNHSTFLEKRVCHKEDQWHHMTTHLNIVTLQWKCWPEHSCTFPCDATTDLMKCHNQRSDNRKPWTEQLASLSVLMLRKKQLPTYSQLLATRCSCMRASSTNQVKHKHGNTGDTVI